MTESTLDALHRAVEAKEKMDKVVEKTVPTSTETLAALQKTATAVQKDARDAEWAEIKSYDFKENTPLAMARLISQMPWGPSGGYLTMANSMALALHWYALGLNPFIGDIFILPSGKIGMSLQGLLKKAKNEGYALTAPVFTDVTRPWPKGLKLKRKVDRTEVEFDMEAEPGVTCHMKVNDSVVEYTAWLTNWFMPGNPNWYNRMDWMLRVSAQKRALSLGTGIAVSEEIADTDSVSTSVKTPEPKEPKSTPFAGR